MPDFLKQVGTLKMIIKHPIFSKQFFFALKNLYHVQF